EVRGEAVPRVQALTIRGHERNIRTRTSRVTRRGAARSIEAIEEVVMGDRRRPAAGERAWVTAFALALLCAPSAACAGAWTREAGGFFLKLGYDRWFTNVRFDSAGRRVDYLPPVQSEIKRAQYRGQAFAAYAEYGLTSAWT